MNYNNLGSEFSIEKLMGDACLSRGDMKGALNQTEICIRIAAEQQGMEYRQFNEIAYKSYVNLAKIFYEKKSKDGATSSLKYAIEHHSALNDNGLARVGIKQELLDYIKGKRADFPLK